MVRCTYSHHDCALGGGILGERVLRDRPFALGVIFVPAVAAMFVPRCLLYPEPAIEWPAAPRATLDEAFVGCGQNTRAMPTSSSARYQEARAKIP